MEKRESREPYLKMSSKATGTAHWKLRLYSVLRYPFTRTVPAVICATTVWVVAYNLTVRLWKGQSHPINRFMWRIKERDNSLDPVLLEKKKQVLEYHSSRLFKARDNVPNLGY